MNIKEQRKEERRKKKEEGRKERKKEEKREKEEERRKERKRNGERKREKEEERRKERKRNGERKDVIKSDPRDSRRGVSSALTPIRCSAGARFRWEGGTGIFFTFIGVEKAESVLVERRDGLVIKVSGKEHSATSRKRVEAHTPGASPSAIGFAR